VKPAAFEYLSPDSLDSAVEMVARYGEAQKVLAGGQSLVPLMNMRLTRVEQLIDLNRLQSLRYVREEEGQIRVGAMTTQRTIERSDLVRRGLPLMADAIGYIGHFQIRNRGTIGGSLAHADPSAELPTMLLVHEGEVEAQSTRGKRTIKAEDFFVSYFTTALEPDEILTEVRFRRPALETGWSFQEVARRHGDFALAAVAVLMILEGERIVSARIAVAAAADRPLRASKAEAALVGQAVGEKAFAHAAEIVSSEVRPTGDVHASADYRRHVAGVLTRRGLAEAHRRVSAAQPTL
jgi:carbon-monoxide dehydrogenase medium subunit